MTVPRQPCEFHLLQYVPDPVRNEFVHVGVIVRAVGDGVESGPGTGAGIGAEIGAGIGPGIGAGSSAGSGIGGAGRVVSVRFTSDWRRVRCLDPEADTGMLESLESELRRRFEEESGVGSGNGLSGGVPGGLLRLLEDSFSNSVQITPAKGYLAESVESGVEELMRLYVEPLKREKVSRLSGRAAIQVRMRAEFERAGVWDLMRKRIRAAGYTRVGDPLRIDVGYWSGAGGGSGAGRGSLVRMFQAVSLGPEPGSGAEAAKVLAFSAAGLRAGVKRVDGAELELTAVVEPVRQGTGDRGQRSEDRDQRSEIRGQGPGNRGQGSGKSGQWAVDGGGEADEAELNPEWLESYRFAMETMEEHAIRVVTTADLGRVAETARREMGV